MQEVKELNVEIEKIVKEVEVDSKMLKMIEEIEINENYKLRDFMEFNPKYHNNKIKFLNITRLSNNALKIKRYNLNRREELNYFRQFGDKSLVFISKGAGGKLLVHPIIIPIIFIALQDMDIVTKLLSIYTKAFSKIKNIY